MPKKRSKNSDMQRVHLGRSVLVMPEHFTMLQELNERYPLAGAYLVRNEAGEYTLVASKASALTEAQEVGFTAALAALKKDLLATSAELQAEAMKEQS